VLEDKLVSAVEWWKKDGKWICSLICYDEAFTQIWLETGDPFSFKVQEGRYCVGYTTLSTRASKNQPAFEPWKAIEPCSFETKIKKGYKCSLCIQADLVHPCLICNGTECTAEPRFKKICEKSTAYVYIASFGLKKVKIGVAHFTRIPQRWIEQGANLAKRIIVGNGIEARRFEHAIHNSLNVLSGLKTAKKVDTLWKKPNTKEIDELSKTEEEIKKRFPEYPYYQDPFHDLSEIYNLPPLDRRPLELKLKKNLQISGKILGVKGALLLLDIGALPYYLNLKHLIGKKIRLEEANVMIMQTALDKF
jgi:hypothetical protein